MCLAFERASICRLKILRAMQSQKFIYANLLRQLSRFTANIRSVTYTSENLIKCLYSRRYHIAWLDSASIPDNVENRLYLCRYTRLENRIQSISRSHRMSSTAAGSPTFCKLTRGRFSTMNEQLFMLWYAHIYKWVIIQMPNYFLRDMEKAFR